MNVLSFLRRRHHASSARLAQPRLIEPLRAIAWDGRVLSLERDPAAVNAAGIAIDVDGHFFANTTCDEFARARFEFAFAPSGRTQFDVVPRLGRDGAALSASALRIGIGLDGIAEVPASSPLPPATLASSARLLPMRATTPARAVAIVVPVYNAAALVERCIESVLRWTQGEARLIIIDDASTESAIAPLLAKYHDIACVEILRNDRNLGFTATANRGMRQARDADVVLLNADAEVGPNWLAGLQRAACAGDDIATVTAVSDNAGAFSVPELEQENILPAPWTFEQCARAVWQVAGLAYPELPTGNGFCMYVRRDVIDQVGLFDEAAFAQGYGEENDFCQRASRDGWRHVIAGNVFVRHARSMSFGDERRAVLGSAGMAVLRERYPAYESDVARTLFSFERRVLDWRIRASFAAATVDNAPKPRVLALAPDTDAIADYALWHLRESGGTVELVDAEGAMVERVAVAERFDAVGRWLQLHAIEVFIGDVAAIAAYADLVKALGIIAATWPPSDRASTPLAVIAQARVHARTFQQEST